ncbi:hypothetical protein SDC9_202082 [bioreactor metagenome]|uniref:Uncharacterized protein n=1 Tax=bioreactor metagenome TaxID=1076179 RepID=A0A645IU94_9ZZZZ
MIAPKEFFFMSLLGRLNPVNAVKIFIIINTNKNKYKAISKYLLADNGV